MEEVFKVIKEKAPSTSEELQLLVQASRLGLWVCQTTCEVAHSPTKSSYDATFQWCQCRCTTNSLTCLKNQGTCWARCPRQRAAGHRQSPLSRLVHAPTHRSSATKHTRARWANASAAWDRPMARNRSNKVSKTTKRRLLWLSLRSGT